jgi:hypothetical protein
MQSADVRNYNAKALIGRKIYRRVGYVTTTTTNSRHWRLPPICTHHMTIRATGQDPTTYFQDLYMRTMSEAKSLNTSLTSTGYVCKTTLNTAIAYTAPASKIQQARYRTSKIS